MAEPIAFPESRPIDEFEGVRVRHRSASEAIAKAADVAEMLFHRSRALDETFRGPRLDDAFASSLTTVNSLIRAAVVECQLAPPPEDIDMVTDQNGNLIYRCRHNPSHRWELSGSLLP